MRSRVRELATIWREGTGIGTVRYAILKALQRFHYEPASSGTKRSIRGMGILGAGTYTSSTHLPLLRAHGERAAAIASRGGRNAAILARIYGIDRVHDGEEAFWRDMEITSYLVASSAAMHPEHIARVAKSGRYTYCEKPAAIDRAGLDRLSADETCTGASDRIMIGFNRRFAPAVRTLLELDWMRGGDTPFEMQYRVNFGPPSSTMAAGGVIHEAACHYVDLISHIAAAPIERVSAQALRRQGVADEDTFVAAFGLANGSVASLTFTSEGSRETAPKEVLDLTRAGHTASIVDFRTLRADGRVRRFRRRTYGAFNAWTSFLAARDGGRDVPVPLADGLAATRVTLAMQQSLRTGGASVDIA